MTCTTAGHSKCCLAHSLVASAPVAFSWLRMQQQQTTRNEANHKDWVLTGSITGRVLLRPDCYPHPVCTVQYRTVELMMVTQAGSTVQLYSIDCSAPSAQRECVCPSLCLSVSLSRRKNVLSSTGSNYGTRPAPGTGPNQTVTRDPGYNVQLQKGTVLSIEKTPPDDVINEEILY
jgi:hypothetical protein